MKLDMSNIEDYDNTGGHNTSYRRTVYNRYIQSPEWQERRKAALERADHACEHCDTTGVTLHAHHLTYIRFGHEHPDDLLVLCKPCHKVADWARKTYGHGWENWIGWERAEDAYEEWLQREEMWP